MRRTVHSGAIQARVAALAEALQHNTSPYSMRMSEGEAESACTHLMVLLEKAAAASTLSNEKSNCVSTGWPSARSATRGRGARTCAACRTRSTTTRC